MKKVNKKQILWGVIILAFFTIFALGYNYSSVKRDLGNQESIDYYLSDMSIQGYEIENNAVLNMIGDANFELGQISTHVNSIKMYFEEPLEQDLNITVYYSQKGEGYSEQNTKSTNAQVGQTEVDIIIDKEVERLRIDVGTNIGEIFYLNKITVNDKTELSQYEYLMTFKLCINILLIITVVLCVYVFIIEEWELHKKYALVAFVLGLFYIVLITPLSSPDEQHHYSSAYKVSNIMMLKFNELDMAKAQHYNFDNIQNHYNVSSAYLRLRDDIFLSNQDKVEISKPYNISYPIQYFPQALGISIARLLNLNFLGVFYLGRIFNLMFYIICIYFSIKLIPIGKLAIFMIAMLPMSMQQASSLSYDAFINGIATLLIASILFSIKEKSNISKNEIIRIVVLSALLAPAKIVYFLISFLVILIPRERFKDRKQHLSTNIMVLVGGISSICLVKGVDLIAFASPSIEELNWEGYPNYSISFILEHPLKTVEIFIRTIYLKGSFYFDSMIGKHLSGLSLSIPTLFVSLYTGLLVLSSIKTPEESKQNQMLKNSEKGLMILVACGTIVLVMLSMFLCWTSTYRLEIEGVQGRYLLPILILFILVLKNNILVHKRDITKYLSLSICMIEICTIGYIFIYTLKA